MYRLKNPESTSLKTPITDIEYNDLFFWSKWKYQKMNLLVSDDEYLNGAKKLLDEHYNNLTNPHTPNSVPAHQIFPSPPKLNTTTTNVTNIKTVRNFDDDDYYDNNSNGLLTGIATGIIIDDLLNQPPQVINDINDYQNGQSTQDAQQFQGFGSGDFGGGGSSGSWGDNNNQQDTTQNDLPPDNQNFS